MLNGSMLHNLPQGLIQDAEEDHACQHHHCCHTLHHISWSQRTDYSAARVAHSFPSDPSIYRRRARLPASSLLPHAAPTPTEGSVRTTMLLMRHRVCLVSSAGMLHKLFYWNTAK